MPFHDLQDAITFLEKREPGEAAVLLEPMVDEMPAYAAARVLLARAYEAQNRWPAALSVWREALHLVPNSSVVRQGVERAVSRITPEGADEEGAQHSTDSHGTAETRDSPENRGSSDTLGPADISASVDTAESTGARERPDHDDSTSKYDDLDRLISELEAARIVPRPDLDNIPTPELEDDIEDVVSETLARIYASQGQYDEAARVYELLAGQHPGAASDYMQKASRMRSRASDGD